MVLVEITDIITLMAQVVLLVSFVVCYASLPISIGILAAGPGVDISELIAEHERYEKYIAARSENHRKRMDILKVLDFFGIDSYYDIVPDRIMVIDGERRYELNERQNFRLSREVCYSSIN